jgi:hypothetical protein
MAGGSDQSNATNFIPVRLSDGAEFYVAGGGGGGGGGGNSGSTPLGYQQLTTALSAAVGLTVPAGATSAVVQAEASDVRWRDDGTNPTPTVGMLLPASQPATFTGAAELAALKFIAATSGSILNVSYFR